MRCATARVNVTRNTKCATIGDLTIRDLPERFYGRRCFVTWNKAHRLVFLSSRKQFPNQQYQTMSDELKPLIPPNMVSTGIHPCRPIVVQYSYEARGEDFFFVVPWGDLVDQPVSYDRSGFSINRVSRLTPRPRDRKLTPVVFEEIGGTTIVKVRVDVEVEVEV